MDLYKRFREAICFYWQVRATQAMRQRESGKVDTGRRGAVTGGAQMTALEELISDILVETGINRKEIFRKTAVELPGYYRPEKKWDLLVVAKKQLVCAIELKSQVGPSFGNNFNNRVDEAIGSAQELWTAYREGLLPGKIRPWLGYLFLLEDCEASSSPVSISEPHFPVDPIFKTSFGKKKKGVSYKKRYEIFCKRLVLERLYDAACFVTSTDDTTSPIINEPDPLLSFAAFIASLRGHITAFLESTRLL